MKQYLKTVNYQVIAMLGILAYIVYLLTREKETEVLEEKKVVAPSFSDLEAESIAEQLFIAMQETFGKDYESIKEAFSRFKNYDDYNFVYNKFDLRHYNYFSGAKLASSEFFDKAIDLTSWLKAELTVEQQREIVQLSNLKIF